MSAMLNRNDLEAVRAHGLTEQEVETQLEQFRRGFPYSEIVRPAIAGDGVVQLDAEAIRRLGARYDEAARTERIVKFVPASGAATRMFKGLYEYLSSGKEDKATGEVLASIDRFAFRDRLRSCLPAGAAGREVIEAIVGDAGLGYGSLPKALILFHVYPDGARTALEEHLVEGAAYARSGDDVHIHFTVSPEHRVGFDRLLGEVLPRYAARFGVRFHIDMSEQKPSTDTVAVNPDNTLFRNADGSLLFRPAGHGALIENLNDLEADIVFVKNIDNVTTDARRADTIAYKRALGGLLVELRERMFALLRRADEGGADEEWTQEATAFVRDNLSLAMPESVAQADRTAQVEWLCRMLDRPLRVCGMVRNEGEPGGGPFFVRTADGSASLQIVESSQIAPQDRPIMAQATYFNPVDLVCSLRDRRGGKYDLTRYVDPDTGFISEKSKDGRPLRALERPGLWNGAMARWNTIFVEVPVTTFTPVKVVNDLLRPAHQPAND